MPTEELFGAYHYLLEVAGSKPTDSFDFTAKGGETKIGMLLPAVQAAPPLDVTEPARDFAAAEEDAAAHGHTLVELLEDPGVSRADEGGGWIDILSVNQGINRSDGGDDFMF